MKNLRAAVFAALFLFTSAVPGRADDVTLTSRDGALEITGTLLGFDGEFYRVETEFGILTVDGSGVNCDGPACPTLGNYVAEFTLSGARAMGEVLIPSLIEGFALNAGYALSREEIAGTGLYYRLLDEDGGTEAARITVRLTTSAEGFADLLGEEADMVLSLREVTIPERNMAREAGLGDLRGIRQFRVLARDALVPIVAPGNPVRRLSMQDLARVYAGEITRWSELGGEDAPITLHLTETDAGIGALFVDRVIAAQGKVLSDRLALHGTIRGLTEAVADDPFGIGIGTLSQAGVSEVVTLTGDCAFEVEASSAAVKAGDYPLTAPLYLYLPGLRLPKLARDFLGYMRSTSAQLVTRRAGFVDQAFTEVPVAEQGERLSNAILAAGAEVSLAELQRMAALFDGKQRLTLTYRFRGGSAALDAPSRANVALLASALETGQFDGRRLVFVGFSDGQGDGGANLRLSQRRANAVRDAVLAEAEAFDPTHVTIETDGFGEALPMACDDSDWGREVNRRVEVWVE
ncbi:phosphate ABC transporter substrate-binding/OmpA family protein [Sinisalibacter aestuarii]|uniref:OmpA family protein n=1 Tax=Sinisalibacter aestuarii TaxID=2949426 RepID=A0ABQ5LN58_9RHOB|nr:phosphate ABC transporter substrate-binding/OmpA family protein [Sinisalibacter aestuarii]GKY86415.1 OmpA family protein [Sinisalibacter aestuarii]